LKKLIEPPVNSSQVLGNYGVLPTGKTVASYLDWHLQVESNTAGIQVIEPQFLPYLSRC